jgi:O-acetyl-ADP-ribose deacetylase (regulator of RNase III)
LNYLIGDATKPIKTPAIIAHICNDIGCWGAGFVLSLSNVNKTPELKYREWATNKEFNGIPFELGNIQLVNFTPKVAVANMIAQSGIYNFDDKPPIRYEALRECLIKLNSFVKNFTSEVSIHMPKIGSGLAGGDWKTIEEIIKETLTSCEVYVYSLS